MLAKLKTFGIHGKMLNVIEDLYSYTNGHVTVADCISDNFEINLGVKQGDPPSPFFFNVYIEIGKGAFWCSHDHFWTIINQHQRN